MMSTLVVVNCNILEERHEPTDFLAMDENDKKIKMNCQWLTEERVNLVVQHCII